MTQRVTVTTGDPDPNQTGTLPSDQQQGTPPPSEGGNELLAGKYKTVEELVKGYKELESKLGKPPQQNQQQQQQDPNQQQQQQQSKLQQIPEAGEAVNFEKYAAEFAANGSLSDASFEELAKAGISKEVVTHYIAGVQASVEKRDAEVVSSVGGAETYNAMIEWAKVNMTPAEKQAFNKSLDGDIESVKLAVQGLHGRFTKATGTNPKLVQGGGGSSGGAYTSMAQLTADMKDPRYQKDPAYRKMVSEKLARSNF